MNELSLHEIFSTKEDRRNLFIGLIKVASSDGIIDDNEKEILKCFSLDLNFFDEYQEIIESEETEFSFINEMQEERFIEEALKLALIDGNYCENENATMKKVVSNFGWAEGKLEKIEKEHLSMSWLKSNTIIEID